MKYPRILSAVVVDDYTLGIEFSNGDLRKYDFRNLLAVPMFIPLKNPVFFRSFKVETDGYGIFWSDDTDISEYELWKNGTPEALSSCHS